jgi:hypothetical protein
MPMSAGTRKENAAWLTDHLPAAFLSIIETPVAGDTRQ